VKKAIRCFIILFSFMWITSGCSKTQVTSNELDKIQIKLISTSIMPDGTAYALKLVNNSAYVIKQNNVYLSYPIKIDHGSTSNHCKVEAQNNKINIKPKQQVLLNIFMQKCDYQGNDQLMSENPEIEFTGYFSQVAELNHFQKSGPLAYFGN
jgi:hypothetical protein